MSKDFYSQLSQQEEIRRGILTTGEAQVLEKDPDLSLLKPVPADAESLSRMRAPEVGKSGEPMAPDQLEEGPEGYVQDLLGMYGEITQDETALLFQAQWAAAGAKELGKRLSHTQRFLESSLLEASTSAGLLYSFSDSLSSPQFIDQALSTAELDFKKGVARHQDLLLTSVTREQLDPSFRSESSHLLATIELDEQGAGHQRKKTGLLSYRTYVSNSQSGSLVLNLRDVPGFAEARGLMLRLPVRNGIEEIWATWQSKAGKLLASEKVIPGTRVWIPFPAEEVVSMELELKSSRIDGFDRTGRYHEWLVDGIELLQGMGAAQVWTKPVQFVDAEDKQVKFHSLYVETEPKGIGIQVEVIDSGKSYWSGLSPLKSERVQSITPVQVHSNKKTFSEQQITPLTGSRASSFATLPVALSPFNIPGLAEGHGLSIDPDSIILLRGAGVASGYKDASSSSFSESETAGWLRVGSYYLTHAFLPPGESFSFDLGHSQIMVDGVLATGKQRLVAGTYRIEVPVEAWVNLVPGLTEARAKDSDPLYPHNPRYLIQGYTGVPAYKGVPLFGERLCQYDDPDLLIPGPDTLDRFTLEPFVDSQSLQKTRILLPIERGYKDFHRERVIYWFEARDESLKAEKFRLVFDLKDGQVLDSYSVRAA